MPPPPPQKGRQKAQGQEHCHVARQIHQLLGLGAPLPKGADGPAGDQVDRQPLLPPLQGPGPEGRQVGKVHPDGSAQGLGGQTCEIQRQRSQQQLPPPPGALLFCQQPQGAQQQPGGQGQQHDAPHFSQIMQYDAHFSSTIFKMPSAMAWA